MEELKRFHSSTFDTNAKKKLVKILSLNSLKRYKKCIMKSFVWMIRKIFKMLNQYAVDNPSLPIDLCLSHLIQFLLGCKAVLWEYRAAKMDRQAFGTHMVYRETFLQIQLRRFQHLIHRKWIHWVLVYQNTHHHMWWVRTKHQFKIRDASQDRQSEIQSSLVRTDFQRIMGQTNNDCRSQIFISTNSLHQQHLLVGRSDSKLRCVFVQNFHRVLCCGSKKWSWLTQCMI